MTGRIICCLVALLVVPSSFAQKKIINEARAYIKAGKDFDKAEKLMVGLLKKDSSNRENTKIYDTWFDAVEGQYEQANEKLYLKQKYDTAAFFGLTKRLYEIALTLDTLDARPDAKGRVKLDYREDNSEKLNTLRPNLYFGGTYHIRKEQYRQAYDFFSYYLNAAQQPLFERYHYATSDSRMPSAAYWATYCGYKLQDADMALHFSQQALKDVSKAQFVLQYMCEAYQQQKDEAKYLNTLQEGFKRYPEYPYFFPRLADYYTAQGRSDSLLTIANEGLAVNEKNTLFLLAKSLALLNMERYEECTEVSKQLIALNDTLPEPYFNIATCYLNQALELEQSRGRKQRKQLQELYSSARPYMEDYRRLVPEDSKRWAPALYRIYLNLNMGKEFEEIDQLMK